MSSENANDPKLNEKIFEQFQQLRNDQRNLVNNMNTLEMDLKEHRTVIDTLQLVDQKRKCFRLIGSVLCERTVADVLPQLIENKNFIEKNIQLVNENLTKKGMEINKFKQQHNIKIRGDQIMKEAGESNENSSNTENRNILVSAE